MALGKSSEDYLEAILVLKNKAGHVRSVDVANYMGFSKPSVSHAVKELGKKEYLTMAADGALELTEKGREIAEQVYERHRFFTELLCKSGISPEVAEKEACEIEHVISEESFQKIKKSHQEQE